MLTGMLGVKSNTPEQLLKAMNMLGMGTTITGDIKTEGDIRIDGKVIGKVSINSKLAVGESGIIEGDVQCKNASIEGRIKGNLHISELVFLRKTAVIDGDIYAAKLVVEEGAKINGKCSMGGAPATPAAHQQNTESSARLKSETNK
jgi:cytoskeletal protein CcmA (bactofilin family)